MITATTRTACLVALTACLLRPPAGHAQGTAITYQGRLSSAGQAASGLYDFRFRLAADPLGNNYFGSPYLTNAVAVSNGLFTATLDFGAGAFTGPAYWLEIDLRTNGAVYYQALAPLQPLAPTPYAIYAGTASNLVGSVSAAQIAGGTLANAILPASPVFAGPVLASAFVGNGAGLTNLNAAAVANGILPATSLPPTVARLNSNQIFAAQNVFAQSVGFGNPAPFYPVDVLSAEAVVALESTNSPFGGQIYFQNDLANTNQYLGAMLFFDAAGADPGAISYYSAQPTNHNFDSLNFSVGGSGALKLMADPRGTQVGSWLGGNYGVNAISTLGCGGDVIAGGGVVGNGNVINSNSSQVFIGAGYGNQVGPNADNAVIGGGFNNATLAPGCVVGGGSGNIIRTNCSFSVIGGGGNNQIGYIYPNFVETFLPGHGNLISGGGGNYIGLGASASVIGGGVNNLILANASCATILGGSNNWAAGLYSFAGGQQARALYTGDFVWADSQALPFAAGANDQFLIRAQGGVGINRTNPATALDVNGTASATSFIGGSLGLGLSPLLSLDVLAAQASARFASSNSLAGSALELKTLYAAATNLGAIKFNNSSNTYPGQIAYQTNDVLNFTVGGVSRMTLGSAGLTVNGTLVSSSDRNAKQDFAPVDPGRVLDKVAQLPVQTWAYKDDPGTQHLGPMAQDFYAAFGTGADDRHIAVVDEGGVALAAIQGLLQRLDDKESRILALERRLDRLERASLASAPAK